MQLHTYLMITLCQQRPVGVQAVVTMVKISCGILCVCVGESRVMQQTFTWRRLYAIINLDTPLGILDLFVFIYGCTWRGTDCLFAAFAFICLLNYYGSTTYAFLGCSLLSCGILYQFISMKIA